MQEKYHQSAWIRCSFRCSLLFTPRRVGQVAMTFPVPRVYLLFDFFANASSLLALIIPPLMLLSMIVSLHNQYLTVMKFLFAKHCRYRHDQKRLMFFSVADIASQLTSIQLITRVIG